jgi:hypothetical protein
MFSEEAQTVRACCRYGTEIQKKIARFGMVVRPAPQAYVIPQLRFIRCDDLTALWSDQGKIEEQQIEV